MFISRSSDKFQYYYLLRLSSFYSPDYCKCYLFSLVTPVYSLYICSALFGDFNKLNDGDDDDDDDVKH